MFAFHHCIFNYKYLFLKTKFKLTFRYWIFFLICLGSICLNAQENSDKSNTPKLDADNSILNFESDSQLSSIFKDIIVVQRQAIRRDKKKFLSVGPMFDFSDGPIDQTAIEIKAGYAPHQNWEFHLFAVPVFLTKNRPISESVSSLTLANGQKAELVSPKAKSAFGLDVNWILAYGKDAWGPYTIIRSDTFTRLQLANYSYEDGSNGLLYSLGLGKSFFTQKKVNFRIVVGLGSRDTKINNENKSSQFGFFEPSIFWMF